jgi:murein L,D-transpeptidase YcbB/YkuD
LTGRFEEVAMSVRRTIGVVGAVLAGTVSASGSSAPPADPGTVRALLVDIGMLPRGAAEAAANAALRRFQARVGLPVDGVAGPMTCRALVHYAREARELRDLGFAA